MKLLHYTDPVHLSYCTNVHAGEQWLDTFAQLQAHLPIIKAQVAERDSFGIGLRLSHAALTTLEQGDVFAELQAFLQLEDLYVFTINGFPYGSFHDTPVKEQVYRPDWTTPTRRDYTNRLATLLARLDPPDDFATISTLPGTFGSWARGACPAIARHLLDSVAHCVEIERATGKQIAIALEAEPCCLLETVTDIVDFFGHWLTSDAAQAYLCRRIGTSKRNAQLAIERHLGVCHDICHAAVEFEDPEMAIDTLQSAGIAIHKVQISSALRIPAIDAQSIEHLQAFSEPVYLHQVVERDDDRLTRFVDLHEAMAAWDTRRAALPAMHGNLALDTAESVGTPEWRVHFHVPVFLESMDQFETTQADVIAVLERQRREPFCRHFEVETYTWGVLPARYRDSDTATAIAREVNWAAGHL